MSGTSNGPYADLFRGEMARLVQNFDEGFTLASEIEPRSPDWFWQRRIVRGDINVLAGTQGLGKSHFGLFIAAEASRKGTDVAPVNSLILSAEDSAETTLVPRLMAADADLDHVAIMNEDLELLLTPEHMDRLLEYVRTFGAQFCFVDPVLAFVPDKIDSYKDQHVRTILRALRTIAHETGCTFLLCMHLKKGLEREAVNAVAGAGGWTAAPRSVLMLTRDTSSDAEDNARVLFHAKCNVGPLQEPLICSIEPMPYGAVGPFETSFVQFGGESSRSLDEALGHEKTSDRLDEAEKWLVDVLAAGPVATAHVESMAESDGITKATLKRARKSLGIKSRQRPEGGWELTLQS